MKKDLGTYWTRVTLSDGTGWIERYNTSGRFVGGGTECVCPITATWAEPTFETEEEVVGIIIFNYRNNWGCDCNRELDYARAYQLPEPEGKPCFGKVSEKFKIKLFEILNPAGIVVYREENFDDDN